MKSSETDSGRRSLGQYLASTRQDRKLTLQDVEEATGKEVSNAYLSQMENDKIKRPSPNILLVLSTVYDISYEQLMEMAGYSTSSKKAKPGRRKVPTFAEHNLTAEEEQKLLEYLQFLRSRK
ncbi:helix-turn-helix domain-containing protein [Roseibium sp. M-1]